MSATEQPRVGLRKADDADVHPSTPVGSPDAGWLRSGGSTADAIDSDKPVTLEVTVPKSLRKAVRQEAKRRGISVDEVVAEALRHRPSR